jgi:Icc-related predicted phosphoesterase
LAEEMSIVAASRGGIIEVDDGLYRACLAGNIKTATWLTSLTTDSFKTKKSHISHSLKESLDLVRRGHEASGFLAELGNCDAEAIKLALENKTGRFFSDDDVSSEIDKLNQCAMGTQFINIVAFLLINTTADHEDLTKLRDDDVISLLNMGVSRSKFKNRETLYATLDSKPFIPPEQSTL